MSLRLSWSLAAIGLLALAGGAARAVSPAQASAALVKTAPAHILVSARGMTIYLYTPDKPNKSTCTGACATYWPPVALPRGTTTAPSIAGVGGTFGVAKRADGTRQLTYDGAPLYTFVGDKKPGDMTGQGTQGGSWWVVVATTASHAVASAPTPSPTAAPLNSTATATPAAASAATPTAAAIQPTPTPSSGGGYGGY